MDNEARRDAAIQAMNALRSSLATTTPTPLTQHDIALLAAHVGTRQDGQPATYADALDYLCLHTPKQRQALVKELWRRYGPEGQAR